ncbi:hypothetical protein CAOG_00866 [Capsaspora owczarzaki ATCC 30864]|uniref:RUN domain-containing protein n=1 Tax=Capsaspora owczarzaki (strain ATCC 30864) TaxID=595528 RepID=A0A0D2VHE7_CAPO3|nr:hypothetical protein CAOG_00866 [Capsaspora owczarzaki ATCC 30864]KJE89387.1 hypothetical protein CAOG_000866 [Capsaspora owczarzaki ATCC 30864]|eukprot:XP_004365737.1 hypothetical protein CAOG_00866 [Capsaspora owczarzaki ATCC 30864]
MNIEQEDILSDRLIDALNTSISSAAAGPAVLGQHGSQSSLTALGPTPPPLASPYHQQHGHGQGHPRHDAGSPLSSLSSRGAAARAANGASPYSTSNSSFTSSPASTSPTLTPDMTSLQQQQQQQQQQQHGYSEPFAPLSPAGRTHAAAMSMSLGLAPPSSSTALVSTALNLTSVDEYGRAVAEAARLVDRRNLLAAFKASVQSVLSHAAHNGSSLDDTSIGVQQFCLILEKILYHGLKPPKKGWISSRHCEFWDVLELAAADNRRKSALVVSRLRPVVTAIESYCKSPRGKSRVFIRMALMEKRLAEYLQFVLQNPERLGEYYEREALLRGEEESLLIIGSLVGLNVIDFIFCIKGTQMDDPTEQPIDFGTLLLMTASTRTDSALEDAKQSEQRFPVSSVWRNPPASPPTSAANLAPQVSSSTVASFSATVPFTATSPVAAAVSREGLLAQIDALQRQTRVLQEQKSYIEQLLRTKESALESESMLRRVAETQADKLRTEVYTLRSQAESERTQAQTLLTELRRHLGDDVAKRVLASANPRSHGAIQSNRLPSYATRTSHTFENDE